MSSSSKLRIWRLSTTLEKKAGAALLASTLRTSTGYTRMVMTDEEKVALVLECSTWREAFNKSKAHIHLVHGTSDVNAMVSSCDVCSFFLGLRLHLWEQGDSGWAELYV